MLVPMWTALRTAYDQFTRRKGSPQTDEKVLRSLNLTVNSLGKNVGSNCIISKTLNLSR